ncbi:hypothetical protein ACHQM5_028400 [Ranunculus cassubicifolius]
MCDEFFVVSDHQRDANGLNTENNELKLRLHRLHTMEQQVRLQDALNDALRDEVQRLKLMTGQNISGAGSMMNFGPPRPVHGGHSQAQQFYPNNNNQHAMHLLAAQQFQQLQIQQQSHHIITTTVAPKGGMIPCSMSLSIELHSIPDKLHLAP